jgi:hypothetical protein
MNYPLYDFKELIIIKDFRKIIFWDIFVMDGIYDLVYVCIFNSTVCGCP